MTQVATRITLSVADRVRDWSRQERDLAVALRGLYAATFLPSPPTPVPPEDIAPSVNLFSPLVVAEPVHWIEQSPDSVKVNDVDPGDGSCADGSCADGSGRWLLPIPVPMAPVPMAPPPAGLIPGPKST